MAEGKILILGSKGMLGGQLIKVFGNDAIGWDRADVDVTDYSNLKSKILNLSPLLSAVINCVAYNDVDGAEDNRDLAYKLNSEVPESLAKICKQLAIPLVHFSTNYVFDGERGEYNESADPHPLSVYADSKYQGELKVQHNTNKYYLVRTAVIFGPKGESELSKKSFVDLMLELSSKQNEIKAVNDEINSITNAVDLSAQVKLLLERQLPYGFYHITNSGQASWYDLAREIFQIIKKDIRLFPVSSGEFSRKARRPKKAVLINTKLPTLRPWQQALASFLTP